MVVFLRRYWVKYLFYCFCSCYLVSLVKEILILMGLEKMTLSVCTSEAGGVLGRVGAGVGVATGCCDSGCGADDASVLRERKKRHKEEILDKAASAKGKPQSDFFPPIVVSKLL